MSCRLPGPWLAAGVAWLLAAPVVAQESSAPTAPIALQNELTTSDIELKAKIDADARKTARESDVEMWSIALIGPAAILFIVTALGLMITVRSLRQDFRRERTLNGYWQHGAIARARTSRN